MAGIAQPLGKQFAITNPDGTPTDYFIRWAQQRQIDITGGITEPQAVALIEAWSAEREIIAGVALDGGGPLNADITIDHADTAVTPNTYGDATHVPQFTVDQQGHITNVSEVAISGGGGGGGGVWGSTFTTFGGGALTSAFAGHGMVFTPYVDVNMTGANIFIGPTATSETYDLIVAPVTSKTTATDGACTAATLGTIIQSAAITFSVTGDQIKSAQFPSPAALVANTDYFIGTVRTDSTGVAVNRTRWGGERLFGTAYPGRQYLRLLNFNTTSMSGASSAGFDSGSAWHLCVYPFGTS